MCDTIVVLGNSSEDGSVIFGKNSDRDPNEAHMICYSPRTIHKVGEIVQCQYLSIPQVKETYSIILSKPVWLNMGCEMGANEFGVIMGNEAVFTREQYKRKALLGMELMTLALQRSKTARTALKVVTDLISEYGQGGLASHQDPNFIYHNSFIIADLKEAWILETADRFWVAKQVQNIASISNGLTIQKKWDLAAPGLVENAMEKGWCDSQSEFDFSLCYSDPGKRALSGCLARQAATINPLLEKKGQITVSTVMKILRTHENEPFRPDKGTMASVCGHYNSQTVHQTTASYVASLAEDFQVHWLTGTSAPCLSIFKPFFFKAPEPLESLKQPLLKNNPESLWWRHEKLHRLVLMDYPTRAPIVSSRSKELESESIEKIEKIRRSISSMDEKQVKNILFEASSNAINKNLALIDALTDQISSISIENPPRKVYSKFWVSLSERDNLNLT